MFYPILLCSAFNSIWVVEGSPKYLYISASIVLANFEGLLAFALAYDKGYEPVGGGRGCGHVCFDI
jgi:hypothetical protein